MPEMQGFHLFFTLKFVSVYNAFGTKISAFLVGFEHLKLLLTVIHLFLLELDSVPVVKVHSDEKRFLLLLFPMMLDEYFCK